MSTREKTFTPALILQMLIFIVIIPLLPVLISWRFNWWEAWTFAAINILGFIFSRLLAAKKHPDLIKERAGFMHHENAKTWDKLLAPLLGFGGGLIPLVAGLDARFHWSQESGIYVKTISLFLIFAGYLLASWALIENRFFSGMVRIQSDRGHKVITGGPYRWIRHPGYAGSLISYSGMPLFLDSVWTFIPVVFLLVVLIIRTFLEDRTLNAELEGYKEYAGKVRYRLLPGVW